MVQGDGHPPPARAKSSSPALHRVAVAARRQLRVIVCESNGVLARDVGECDELPVIMRRVERIGGIHSERPFVLELSESQEADNSLLSSDCVDSQIALAADEQLLCLEESCISCYLRLQFSR